MRGRKATPYPTSRKVRRKSAIGRANQAQEKKSRKAQTINAALKPPAAKKRVMIPRRFYQRHHIDREYARAVVTHAAWPLVPLIFSDTRDPSQRRRLSTIIVKEFQLQSARYLKWRKKIESSKLAFVRDHLAIFEHVAKQYHERGSNPWLSA